MGNTLLNIFLTFCGITGFVGIVIMLAHMRLYSKEDQRMDDEDQIKWLEQRRRNKTGKE